MSGELLGYEEVRRRILHPEVTKDMVSMAPHPVTGLPWLQVGCQTIRRLYRDNLANQRLYRDNLANQRLYIDNLANQRALQRQSGQSETVQRQSCQSEGYTEKICKIILPSSGPSLSHGRHHHCPPSCRSV